MPPTPKYLQPLQDHISCLERQLEHSKHECSMFRRSRDSFENSYGQCERDLLNCRTECQELRRKLAKHECDLSDWVAAVVLFLIAAALVALGFFMGAYLV